MTALALPRQGRFMSGWAPRRDRFLMAPAYAPGGLLAACFLVRMMTVMGRALYVTVIFACPKCETTYQAKQRRSRDNVAGSFGCLECGRPVYAWSGPYEYATWEPFLPPAKHGETRH
jgi:hypothetical protein